MSKKYYEFRPDDEVAQPSDVASDTSHLKSEGVANPYSSTSAYVVGDFCMYEGKAYMCNTAIALPGEAWTAAHWTLANLSTLFTSANTSLMGVCRYPIAPIAQVEGLYTAADSTVNTITPSAATTIYKPAATGKARDYIVTVTQDETAYGVTFDGSFLKDFTDWPTMGANETYIFAFTEVATNSFMVAYKKVS